MVCACVWHCVRGYARAIANYERAIANCMHALTSERSLILARCVRERASDRYVRARACNSMHLHRNIFSQAACSLLSICSSAMAMDWASTCANLDALLAQVSQGARSYASRVATQSNQPDQLYQADQEPSRCYQTQSSKCYQPSKSNQSNQSNKRYQSSQSTNQSTVFSTR